MASLAPVILAALSVVVFAAALRLLRVAPVAAGAAASARDAAQAMAAPDLDDLERERRVQRAALRLLRAGALLALAGAAALALAAIPPLVAPALGGPDPAATLAVLLDPLFILVSLAPALLILLWRRPPAAPRPSAAGDPQT